MFSSSVVDLSAWHSSGGMDMDAARRLWLWQPPEEPSPGDVTIEVAIDEYCDSRRLTKGTRLGYATLAGKWALWLSELRCVTPKFARQVSAVDVSDFLGWVRTKAESDENPGRTFNKHRTQLLAVFRWLVKEGRLESLVRFPDPVEQRSVAGHYFLTRAELSGIYQATYEMHVPRLWSDSRSIGALWRAALVLFYSYGLDTYALFHCAGKERLRWEHVAPGPWPPGRVANVRCKYGWLRWTRQKTGRLLLLPLHPIVQAHLEAIRPRELFDRNLTLFGKAGGCHPNDIFRRLCESAGVQDKVDPETGKLKPWVLKDLRKTCATAHGADRGKLILGHADGTITERHYANRLPEVLRAMRELRYPRAMRAILPAAAEPPAE